MKVKNIWIVFFISILLMISGCGTEQAATTRQSDKLISNLVTYDKEDAYTDWDNEDVTHIYLDKTTANVDGNEGVVVEDQNISIRTTGTYVIEGTLEDGQIVIDAEDDGTVRLVMNGATINSSTSAPIYIKQADKTILSLEGNTENTVTDPEQYTYEDADELKAAIFSKDDLTINGTGNLTVNGNYNDGITSRDELKITGGTIEVTAKDDGIVGRDLFAMKDAAISVTSTGDGIKASNDEDEQKGNIVLQSGSLFVEASKGDGVQAEKAIVAVDGEYTITSGGGSPETIETNQAGGGMEAGGPMGNQDIPTMIDRLLEQIDVSEEVKEQLQNAESFEDMQAIIQENPEIQEQMQTSGGMPGGQPPQGKAPQAPNQNNNSQSQENAGNASNTDVSSQSANEETDSENTVSTKGIKAGTDLTIVGGTFTIDALDDAIHSDQDVTISGGESYLSTGDDALHGDGDLTIEGGTTTVAKSLEGVEATNITITEGTTYIHAEDDGINVNGGSTEGEMSGMGGAGGAPPSDNGGNATSEQQEQTSTTEEVSSEEGQLLIENGYVYINANGDGLDSNSSIKMTGGKVLVYGPTQSMNGSLDYDQSFIIEGGMLVASGSSGMAQGISEESTQQAIMMTFPEMQDADTSIYLEDSAGEQILGIAPENAFQSVLISTPSLEKDESYTFNAGGKLTGESNDGVYQDATYQEGSLAVDFPLSEVMTYIDESGVTENQSNNMFGGNRGGNQRNGDGNPRSSNQN
ncbi:carbohydrate-binding domain-containing protein [Virgibacillus salexigens]|uniref:carbohydrate-binding domain-containing protein n=1 Tax=Virgibacillus TaxID=84406 RepID=UPI0013695878|nr:MULTISPECIES: carbohydrate-binding domain-containing protein [Virgibacillus]